MTQTFPYCLTIAGFDPSGGAGIVADCKTFEQLKVQGLSVMTSNTIQTEDRFFSCNWIDINLILEQLTVLVDRYPVRFIKIGLMRDTDMLQQVLRLLHQRIESPVIIWDPVLKPTHGGAEIDEERFASELSVILKQVTIITPNLPEYKRLFGEKEPSEIAQAYNVMVYLKGGHSEQKGKDYLFKDEKVYSFNPHIRTNREKHGTGCIFSSALTAHLSRNFPLIKACLRSKQYVEKRIDSNDTLLARHR